MAQSGPVDKAILFVMGRGYRWVSQGLYPFYGLWNLIIVLRVSVTLPVIPTGPPLAS
jgi:hypothetical protein